MQARFRIQRIQTPSMARHGVLIRRLSLSPGKLTNSSVTGPSTPTLSDKPLASFFRSEILAKYSARPALICRAERPGAHGGPPSRIRNLQKDGEERPYLAWDYEEFDRNIMALARGLVGLGVTKGDRVGVVMGNNSAYAMLQWACASVGAVLVTLNPAYRLNEFVRVLLLCCFSLVDLAPDFNTVSCRGFASFRCA